MSIIFTMGNDIYKKTIQNLPMFFDIPMDSNSHGAGIFEPLKNVIDFEQAYVFFLNPDSINLRYIFGKERKIPIGKEISINNEIKNELFTDLNMILDSSNRLIKLLDINSFESFLLVKLVIKNTVYGFMLLCHPDSNSYREDELNISKVIGSVTSYKIKDIELSEIFNVQLKALKDYFIQIKEQNKKILESDKIKTEFLANVSHELKTPLNSIIGFSEILSNQFFGKLNDKQLEYVKDIYVSGIHLTGMINEILDISKIEANAMSLHKTEFSISQAVEEVINTVKPLADKKFIFIEKVISDGKVFADFQKIKQILYNLTSNAIKFTPEKGKIKVEAFFEDNNFIIKVEDNGIGIDFKDQKRIFEKFVQLENTYTKSESSTGLGLTITKELVEMHSGQIKLNSEPDKGSTFTVNIPI